MKQNKDVFDSTNVFFFIIRWWKHLFIICFAAALAAVIFSSPYFITPKFQSRVIMFPTTAGSLSRSVLTAGAAGRDFLGYGELSDAERLLQVLESSNIRDRIVERFDLMAHYDIPDDAQFRKTRMIQEYRSNISFNRTQYGAVEIRVRDADPFMAADIANELAAIADTLQNELRFERAQLAYNVAREQMQILQNQVSEAEDSLRKIMGRGVFDIEGQSSMLTRQLAKDLSADHTDGIKAIEENLGKIADYGGAFIYMSNYLRGISGQEIQMQRRYQEAKADLDNFLPFTFVLDSAYEAERKVYPVRWLIVFISTFAAGFTGVIILMVYENLLQKGIIKTKSNKPSK